MSKFNIIYVSDPDSYTTILIDGELVRHSSSDIYTAEIIEMIATRVNADVEKREIVVHSLFSTSTSDIPEHFTTPDEFETWIEENEKDENEDPDWY